MLLLSAPVKTVSVGSDHALVVLIGAAVLLALGALGVWAIWRSRAAPEPLGSDDRQFANLLLAALTPELREYLLHSDPPPELGQHGDDLQVLIERAAYILFRRPRGKGAVSLDELVAGLAALESKLRDLTRQLERVEGASVTQDRLLWAVLGVVAAVVALLAAVVALAAGVVQLVG